MDGVFRYKEKLYLRILPSKRLFHSTTIWEIVNRGDIFALSLDTMIFTVIPGDAVVQFAKEAHVTVIE